MIIDIHGHIVPPEQLKRFPIPPSLADIDGLIEQKARAGIELTIVGSPVGGGTMMKVPGLDNFAQSVDQIKAFNDFLAGTVAKHPDRLRAYAYTNPFGDDAMLREAERAVREDGFVGLIINTSVRGEYLDSEKADPFFALAAELDVPILLHPPAEPVGSQALRDYRLVEQVGRFSDVTVGLSALLFGGRLEQYPNLKLIGATAGGAISLSPGRLDMAYRPAHWNKRPEGAPGGPPGGPPPGGPAGGPPPGAGAVILQYENKITREPSAYLRQLHVDTATPSGATMMANLDVLGADHVLFGTDSPPLATPFQAAIDLVNRLPIPEDDKQKIFSGNARRLFKLDGTPSSAS